MQNAFRPSLKVLRVSITLVLLKHPSPVSPLRRKGNPAVNLYKNKKKLHTYQTQKLRVNVLILKGNNRELEGRDGDRARPEYNREHVKSFSFMSGIWST